MRRWIPILCCLLFLGCGKTAPTLAGGKPVSHWVQALHDPNVKIRKEAALKLGNVGTADPAAIPALIEALKDRDASVRSEAILGLVKSGPDAAAARPALEDLQKNDRDTKVRSYAARGLEKIR